MSSYEYRQFLINNANNIMNVNNQYTVDKVSMSNCTAPEMPFKTVCDVNKQYSKCAPTNLNGIGIQNVVNQNVINQSLNEYFASPLKK